MITYIKSIQDFSTLAVAQAESWDLPLATAGEDSGSVVLLGEAAAGREGNWLLCDGRVYLITQTAFNSGLTTLTVQMPVEAFDRGLYYAAAGASIEAFIAAAFDAAYKSIADSYFAMPYLGITVDSSTAFAAPELSDGMYKLSDYIKAVRPPTYSSSGEITVNGVCCDFGYKDEALTIRIHSETPAERKAVFDTSLFQLKSRACSREIVAKVSVISTAGAELPFYLTARGAVSPSTPAERVKGKWVSVAASANEAAVDTAKKAFEGNQDTHKVEFYSREQFNLLDAITMRLGDAVERYQITCIRKSSVDDRYLYICGDMPMTLTDKVKQLGKNRR